MLNNEDTYKSVAKQGNYRQQILKNIMNVLEEKQAQRRVFSSFCDSLENKAKCDTSTKTFKFTFWIGF